MADETAPEAEDVSEARREDETEGSAEAMDASAPDTSSAPDDSATPPEEGEREARAAAEPAGVIPPKERKRRAREAKVQSRRPSTPEERAAERARKRGLRRETRARLREKRRQQTASRAGLSAPSAARPKGEGRQKTRQGVVVSDRAAKTITVRIDTAHRHRRYEKIVRTSRTLHAHDERGEAHIGDTVVVRECRPLSRTKRWRLERVVERAG